MKPYQHPITFEASGNLAQDYQFAFADYDTNLTSHLPANRSAKDLTPKRLLWIGLQSCLRALWRIALFSELGSDGPRVLTKNLYAVAHRNGS
jgi:hypothetical protein